MPPWAHRTASLRVARRQSCGRCTAAAAGRRRGCAHRRRACPLRPHPTSPRRAARPPRVPLRARAKRGSSSLQAKGDVVENRHGKRCRLLEHHPDAIPQACHIDAGSENSSAPSRRTSPVARCPGYRAYMRFEHAQQRRFATAGRSDERRNAAVGEFEIDVDERTGSAVVKIKVAGLKLRRQHLRRIVRCRLRPRRAASGAALIFASRRPAVPR